jgi:hypothetical protein
LNFVKPRGIRFLLVRFNEHKNARLYGNQREKNSQSCLFNGISVTKVEPGGLGSQRRGLGALETPEGAQCP